MAKTAWQKAWGRRCPSRKDKRWIKRNHHHKVRQEAKQALKEFNEGDEDSKIKFDPPLDDWQVD